MGVEFGELNFEGGNFLFDEASVGLYLRFAGTAHANAAALALKVCPHTGEARKHILKLGELDLCAGGGGAGVACEDVEDEGGAVENAALHLFLEVAELRGRQFIVDDNDVGIESLLILLYFVEFSGADIGAGVGTVELLNDFVNGDTSSGTEEEFKFVEIFFGTFEGLAVGTNRDKYSLFRDFLVDKSITFLRCRSFPFFSDTIPEFAFLIWSVLH